MCFIFICLDVSRSNKLKLMLQKREGKQRDSEVLSFVFLCQPKLLMSCPCTSSSKSADRAGGCKHRATLTMGHTKTSCSGRACACVPVWDVGLEALLPTAPSEIQGCQPLTLALHSAQHRPFPVYAWQTWRLSGLSWEATNFSKEL